MGTQRSTRRSRWTVRVRRQSQEEQQQFERAFDLLLAELVRAEIAKIEEGRDDSAKNEKGMWRRARGK